MRQTTMLFPLLFVFYEIGAYLSNDMYLPALPNIMSEMGITQHDAQLTLTLWFLGSASVQLIIGPLSDRFGRRPIIILGGIGYILTSAICAMTTDISTLLIARFVQGITVSTVIVAGYASIHELFDQLQAIRILATMNSITVLAPAFGPLIGSFLLNFMDWRDLFWIIAIWAFVLTSLLYQWAPESLPVEKRQAIHFKSIAKRYFAIISNRRFTLLHLSFCFTFCGFIAWLTAGPFIVVDEFHKTPLEFGVLQTIVFLCYIFATQSVKKLIKHVEATTLIRIGLTITSMGGVIAAVITKLYPDFLFGLVFGMCIYALGSGLSFPPLNRLAIETSDEPMGVRIAMSSTFVTFFGVFGSLFGTVFYTGSMSSLAYVLFSVSICGVIFKLLAGSQTTSAPTTSTHNK